MEATREHALETRYRAIQAYGRSVEVSLPNAREVGLVAYDPIRQAHDGKIARCAAVLRKIENMLNDPG